MHIMSLVLDTPGPVSGLLGGWDSARCAVTHRHTGSPTPRSHTHVRVVDHRKRRAAKPKAIMHKTKNERLLLQQHTAIRVRGRVSCERVPRGRAAPTDCTAVAARGRTGDHSHALHAAPRPDLQPRVQSFPSK